MKFTFVLIFSLKSFLLIFYHSYVYVLVLIRFIFYLDSFLLAVFYEEDKKIARFSHGFHVYFNTTTYY